MKGKITNFKADKGFGFISGEDNQKYFFHISAVSNPMDIEEGYSVDFKTKEGKKGLNAVNITVQVTLSGGRSADKMLKIKDLRIKASDIKEYNVTKKLQDGSYQDEDGNYYIKLNDKGTYYKYDGLSVLEKSCNNHPYWGDTYYYNIDNHFSKINTKEIITDLVGICIANEYGIDDFISLNSSFISSNYFKRDCYTLLIQTYTNGTKELEFRSHDGDKNKEEAYKWLDYIDDEMDKLI